MSSAQDRTYRVVAGALNDTITHHGPIRRDGVPSATKRIVAQIRAAAEQLVLLGIEGDTTAQTALEQAHKRYQNLQHGHEILRSQHEALRTKCAALEAELARVAPYLAVHNALGYSMGPTADA